MPAFDAVLPSDDRWALIDFMKARNNAGEGVRTTGRWNQPVPLPQFDAVCADGLTIDLDDLRGRVLHLIAALRVCPRTPKTSDSFKVATIILSLDRKVKPVGSVCVTIEPTAWTAFSIILGVAAEALPETQALADQNGWLRSRWRPGDPGNWNDPRVLAAVIRDIA